MVTQGRVSSRMELLWPLVVRWLHHATVEDAFDRAEVTLGLHKPHSPRWSLWVRLLRGLEGVRARESAVPRTALLAEALPRVDWADAYAVPLQPGMPADPQTWADAVFHDPPGAVVGLLWLRNALVELVGIERGDMSAFDPVARTADEVLLGTDAGHLDFRVSVLRDTDRVVLSTVVQVHNARGRLYSALVRRVHPIVVRTMLNTAARRLAVRVPVPRRAHGLP